MAESLDELHKLNKGFFFGSVIFMDFFGSDFAWYLFFERHKNAWAEPPVIYVLEYTPWGLEPVISW